MSRATDATGKTLVVISGPTGVGKTAVGVELAVRFGAPVVSADSRQIYRGMAIGTAQPTAEEVARAPHHMVASHDITEEYTAGRYEREALELLDRLFAAHDVVMLVGGSGMYVDALCYGMDSLPDGAPETRVALMSRLESEGLGALLEELRRLDPQYYDRVDRSNPQRVVRALEVCLAAGRPYSSLRTGVRRERPFRIVRIGLTLPRPELYTRIDRRVDQMMALGLEDEARSLYPHRNLNALQTVGYREMFEYFDGRITLEQAVELIKRNSRRYAKRQMTWLTRNADIAWFAPGDTDGMIEYIERE